MEAYSKVCKIADSRINDYTKRIRAGRHQTFYTGNDYRDFDRYRAEGEALKHGVIMHNKPDTIIIDPPEKHYFAELIDGEWWWVNGCAECNGHPRDWETYIECEKHDVCRTCKTHSSEINEIPWGGKNGWQCKPCAEHEHEENKRSALEAMEEKEYCELDYSYNEEIICPWCNTTICSDDFHESGEIECSVCDNIIDVEVEYTVNYSTSRKEPNNG